MNKIIGIIVGILSFIIVIYIIETNKSLLQLFIGFIIFIIPIIFISSLRSNLALFILTITICGFGYFIYKSQYVDLLYGLLLSTIIGGAIAYFRVGKYTLLSVAKYKNGSNKG